MARSISRNPNQILYRKPNQFPTSRFQEFTWGKNCPINENDTDGDNNNTGIEEDKPSTEQSNNEQRLQYLRNRFNKPTCTCSTGSEGQS